MQQVNGIKSQLDAMQAKGDIASYTYVSPEQGLKDLRARLTDPSILDELPSNPLPAKFNVKPTDPTRSPAIIAAFKVGAAPTGTTGDTASATADASEFGPGIDPQLGISYGEKTADKLLTVARFIQWAGLGLISILLVASILLIGNTIRLSIFARRREVEVMKLVGATNWFIRWPFVIEGIFCGLVGAVLAVFLLWTVKVTVVDTWVRGADSALTRDQATAIAFPLLGLILIASGALVGALGSGITLRRFLKV